MTGLVLRSLVAMLLLMEPRADAHAVELPVLAELRPWPAVSNLIAFKGRVWFVNSVRYPDHNSSDVYSYDSHSNEVRFERSLFSQDAGRPTVHRGLLYWPHEDPRSSQSWGEIAATDGENWRLFIVRSDEPSFHLHALASAGDRLFASSSAWVAGLDVSDDGGHTWLRLHRLRSPDGGITRIPDLVSDGRQVYGPVRQHATTGDSDRSFLRANRNSVFEIGGRPPGTVSSLAVFRDQLYVIAGGVVWRATEQSFERLTAEGERKFALMTADQEALFGLVQHDGWGEILKSADGRNWFSLTTFSGGEAEDFVVYNGVPFIGGRGVGGTGVLWGTRQVGSEPVTLEASRWPKLERPSASMDWKTAAATLDDALQVPANYESHGRPLRALIWPWIGANPPDDFFAQRLEGSFAAGEVEIFGGQHSVARMKIGRWSLLWAMAVSRTGRVPVTLFTMPWDEAPNRQQKWFHPMPIALHAARWLKQNDRTSLDALVGRLDQSGDPDWLRHEVMATLATLTEKSLGWEPEARRVWWSQARKQWPDA